MAQNKESYYMVIPSNVWDTDLNPKAILCYGHITVLANKSGYCYANNKYFERVLGISDTTVGRYLNELEGLGLIKRTMIYEKDSKQIKERRIYLNTGIFNSEHSPIFTGEHSPIFTDEQDNNTSNNNTSNNITDDDRLVRIENLYWKKLVPAYPPNRIGNRQHGIKKWLQLEERDMVLAIKNLDRYLNVAGSYVKSLQNYLTERCFAEEWLKAEEETKAKKNDTTKKPDTKKFNGNYDDVD